MKFTRELPATITVRSVDADGIRINDELWTTSVGLTPDAVLPDWPDKPLDALSLEDFAGLLRSAPELVLLGTGASGSLPPRELVFAFARQGIGFEVMDSAAAARTFNVLVGEGRRVAAVLYSV